MRKRIFPPVLLLAVLFVVITVLAMHEAKSQPTLAFAAAQKQVYLTFDDGPSTVVTNRILDILQKEDVKATFFIVSDRAETRRETLLRIAKEGHTVGVHSASHDYSKIYASDEAFLKRRQQMRFFYSIRDGHHSLRIPFPGRRTQPKRAQERNSRAKGISCRRLECRLRRRRNSSCKFGCTHKRKYPNFRREKSRHFAPARFRSSSGNRRRTALDYRILPCARVRFLRILVRLSDSRTAPR